MLMLPPVIIYWRFLVARASMYWKSLHQFLPAGRSLLYECQERPWRHPYVPRGPVPCVAQRLGTLSLSFAQWLPRFVMWNSALHVQIKNLQQLLISTYHHSIPCVLSKHYILASHYISPLRKMDGQRSQKILLIFFPKWYFKTKNRKLNCVFSLHYCSPIMYAEDGSFI